MNQIINSIILSCGFDAVFNIIVLCLLYISYYIYKVKYVFMKSKTDLSLLWHMFFILIGVCVVFLAPHYFLVNNIVYHDWNIRLETCLWIINIIFAAKIYMLFGGLSILEIVFLFKTVVASFFTGQVSLVSSMRDRNLIPFTLKRIIIYASRNKSNGYIKKELEIILNLIDKVTYQLKEVAIKKKRSWKKYDSVSCKKFLDEVGKETRKYYSLIYQVKIGKREVEAFYSLLNSITPSYDNILREVLMDDSYSDRQRRDKIEEALIEFGAEIKREVQALVELNEEL